MNNIPAKAASGCLPTLHTHTHKTQMVIKMLTFKIATDTPRSRNFFFISAQCQIDRTFRSEEGRSPASWSGNDSHSAGVRAVIRGDQGDLVWPCQAEGTPNWSC